MTEPVQDVSGRRALAAVWLVGSCLIGMPAFFLTFASDQPGDRIAGWLLVVLVMLGVLGAMVSLNAPARSRFRISLLAAAMWFVSGVLVFGSQDHLLDSFWAGGVPILTAITAAAVVLFSGRPPEVGG
jgi:hypothetical protein